MKGAKELETRAVVFELEIVIEAARERVWKALVDETNAWWLAEFHMVGEGSVVTFDTEAGGHLIEKRSDGSSLLWYTTQWCKPQEFIYLQSAVAHDWGGPAGTMLKLKLDPRDESCALQVTQEMYGHVSDKNVESLDHGWRWLFTDGLKKFVEEGVRRDG